jgi:DNA-binding transcriptional LysR family regulator
MPDLNALILFAKVIEAGSFSDAARRLGMPVSTVSRRVAELESHLEVRLIERSTRRLRLTDVGADVLREAQRGREVGESVDAIVSNHRSEPSGLLRVAAPPSISESILAPVICAFQTRYPEVRIQVFVTERFVDFVSEGVDVAFDVGSATAPELESRRILTYRHRLLASPAYLATASVPATPEALLEHSLLAFSYWTAENTWNFVHANGSGRKTVRFRPQFSMNDYLGLTHALLAGAGIGELPPIVRPDLVRDGSLVEVMPMWQFRAVDLSLVHLRNRYLPRPVRLFIDFVSEAITARFPALA